MSRAYRRNGHSGYKEYCATGASTSVLYTSPKQQVLALKHLFKDLGYCHDKIKFVNNVLASEKVEKRIRTSQKVPRTITSRIETLHQLLFNLELLIEQYKTRLDDVFVTQFKKRVYALHQLASLVSESSKDLIVFPRQTKTERIKEKVAELEMAIKDGRKFIKAKIFEVETKALAPKAEKTKDIFGSFFDNVRAKGWHVQTEAEEKADPEEDDSFRLSRNLITTVQRPSSDLLQKQTLIGVVRFPVLIKSERISDHILTSYAESEFGYSVYVVYGGYIVIDKMISVGLHKSVITKSNNILDIDKFPNLLPFVKTNTADDWSDVLDNLIAVRPAKLSGPHYYCPTLPKQVPSHQHITIRDWEFLRCA